MDALTPLAARHDVPLPQARHDLSAAVDSGAAIAALATSIDLMVTIDAAGFVREVRIESSALSGLGLDGWQGQRWVDVGVAVNGDAVAGLFDGPVAFGRWDMYSHVIAGASAVIGWCAVARSDLGDTLLLGRANRSPEGMARYRQLFDSIPDAVLVIDPETRRVADTNLAVGTLPGLENCLPGADFSDLLHPGDRAAVLTRLDLVGKDRPLPPSPVTLADGNPVLLSATLYDEAGHNFLFVHLCRHALDSATAERAGPRSMAQLTALVGHVPLREIVRESTDLIERQCIATALRYTGDNRASAAEILGLSRQSLYSKLHRHGLGNLDETDT